jgi:hypothetical protein
MQADSPRWRGWEMVGRYCGADLFRPAVGTPSVGSPTVGAPAPKESGEGKREERRQTPIGDYEVSQQVGLSR